MRFAKKSNLVTAIMLILLTASYAAPAQANEDGDSFKAKKIERLKTELSLSDEQTAKIQTILDQKQAAMKEQMKDTHDQIAAVLTDEQKAKFQALKEKKKEHRKEKSGKWKKDASE